MSTSFSSQALATSDLQTEVATALRDFYSFLARLPWLEPSDVLEPPAQGWPNISSDNFAPLHKNSAVIKLLKHLPYLRMDGPFETCTLVWSTYPCDYRRDYFQKVMPGINCWEIPDTSQRDYSFPDWVVPLTYGKVHGQYVMLDTTDVFEADDPRAWRNECANPGSTARLSDILNEWKDDYAQLRLIGQTNGNGPVHAETSGEEYKELRALMLSHGWPNNFDRETCRNAMLERDQERLK
ncbi:hypothetical protein EK21DRAFT_82465 [Setomelanomma holmii]|uniref:Uncharacterized protein n=1 Tax=Setomelanomma holmii TaxID=210430 RepID=A0A9P4GWG0_9PLEO|nr:hypothetical protein EK21DRAFT_82465 [Setomelanomma holmii]